MCAILLESSCYFYLSMITKRKKQGYIKLVFLFLSITIRLSVDILMTTLPIPRSLGIGSLREY